MNCPECHFPLRADDRRYGICWRCATLLDGVVERIVSPVDIGATAVERPGDAVDGSKRGRALAALAADVARWTAGATTRRVG